MIRKTEGDLLRKRVEAYLRRTKITATRFGREAVNDPAFVADLRSGRQVRKKMAARIHAWLDGKEAKKAPDSPSRR